MFSFNKYNLFLELLDLTEQAGDSYAEISDYLIESFVPVLDPVKLNEANGDQKLRTAISNLSAKAKAMATQAGGNEVENLREIFKQSATTYGKATQDKESVAALWKVARTGGAQSLTACAIMILGAALVGSAYGPEKAKAVVHQAAAEFGHGVQPQIPPQAPTQAHMEGIEESVDLTEGSLDLMHLPSDVIAWLYDRSEEQMKAAKEIGIAANEVGNKIASGAVLRSDVNVLVLHDSAGKGKFHVYPDGSISFNGELVDGHEDVERLIGVQPEQHEAPGLDQGMSDLGGVEMAGPQISVATFEVVPDEENGMDGMDGMEHFAGGMPPEDDDYEINYGKPPMESLSWDDLLDEGKTAEKFRHLKHRILKKNPKAKTPKLDQVIDMWSSVDEE